eukprot:Colp12_sorted_trinity150504_noHs@9669
MLLWCRTRAILKSSSKAMVIIVSHAHFLTMRRKSYISGVWGLGVATKNVSLGQVPFGACKSSWVLRSTGETFHNGKVLEKVNKPFEEGDVIGCSYDHVQLQFYLNGQCLECPITGIRGEVFPAFYVDKGAILDCNFTDFVHPSPQGYEEIMFEQSIL